MLNYVKGHHPLKRGRKEKENLANDGRYLYKSARWLVSRFTVRIYHFSIFTDFTDVDDSFTRLLFTAKLYMYTVAVLFNSLLVFCVLGLS